MANLITEGFDWIPSGASSATINALLGANGWYLRDNAGTLSAPSGRFFDALGLNLTETGANPNALSYVIPLGKSLSEFYAGIAIFYSSSNSISANGLILGAYDGVNQQCAFGIKLSANGVVRVFRGPGFRPNETTTALGNSVTGVFQQDEWFFLEIHGVLGATAGAVEVRINTVPVVQLSSVNTKGGTLATFDSLCLGGYQPGFGMFNTTVDDFYVNDTTGSENNSWGGNLRVKTQYMVANGPTDNFSIGGTSPAATQWQSVLNTGMNDNQYVYSPNVGDIDLFTPDPNLNSPLVRCLQVRMGLRQDDATQRVARAVIHIGGTDYVGPTDLYTNQDAYTFYKDRWELNPATGVNFTGADVNGLYAGVKVQA